MISIIDYIKCKFFSSKYSIAFLVQKNRHIKISVVPTKDFAKLKGVDGYLMQANKQFFWNKVSIFFYKEGVQFPFDFTGEESKNLELQHRYLKTKFSDMWKMDTRDELMNYLPWIIGIVGIILVVVFVK